MSKPTLLPFHMRADKLDIIVKCNQKRCKILDCKLRKPDWAYFNYKEPCQRGCEGGQNGATCVEVKKK